MITKEQAINADEFHFGDCRKTIGSRGGVTIKQEIWRRNGATQTWKTRPNNFRVPVKYGLYVYGQLRQDMARDLHTREECPLLKEEVPYA